MDTTALSAVTETSVRGCIYRQENPEKIILVDVAYSPVYLRNSGDLLRKILF